MPVDSPAAQPLETLFAGWRQFVEHMPQLQLEPAKLAAVQAEFQEQITALMAMGPQATGISADRRFADAAWAHNPLASHAAAAHLIQTRALNGLVDAVRADAKPWPGCVLRWSNGLRPVHRATFWPSMPKPRSSLLRRRARASPRACTTSCTTWGRATCP